jgi:hypothetical protein
MTTPPPLILRASCLAAELRQAARAAETDGNPRLAALLEQRALYWENLPDDEVPSD